MVTFDPDLVLTPATPITVASEIVQQEVVSSMPVLRMPKHADASSPGAAAAASLSSSSSSAYGNAYAIEFVVQVRSENYSYMYGRYTHTSL